jgi:signal transduction histidine kinase
VASPCVATDSRLSPAAGDPTEILALVAHEMRTPLTALLQALRIIDTGRAGTVPEAQVRFVKMALKNADALLHLTARLQDLRRWESGKTPIRFDLCDVSVLATELVECMAAVADSHGVTLC